jgi:hypothetical protein
MVVDVPSRSGFGSLALLPFVALNVTDAGYQRPHTTTITKMATSRQSQPRDGWKVPTKDLDGNALDIVVAVEEGVLVVTLF